MSAGEFVRAAASASAAVKSETSNSLSVRPRPSAATASTSSRAARSTESPARLDRVVRSGDARLHRLREIEPRAQHVQKLGLAILETVRGLREVVDALPFVRARHIQKRVVQQQREVRRGDILKYAELRLGERQLRRHQVLAGRTEAGVVAPEVDQEKLKRQIGVELSRVVPREMRTVVGGGLPVPSARREVRHERLSALHGPDRQHPLLGGQGRRDDLRPVRHRERHEIRELEPHQIHA